MPDNKQLIGHIFMNKVDITFHVFLEMEVGLVVRRVSPKLLHIEYMVM